MQLPKWKVKNKRWQYQPGSPLVDLLFCCERLKQSPEGSSSQWSSASSAALPCRTSVSRYFRWSLNSDTGLSTRRSSQLSLESSLRVWVISCTKSLISLVWLFLGGENSLAYTWLHDKSWMWNDPEGALMQMPCACCLTDRLTLPQQLWSCKVQKSATGRQWRLDQIDRWLWKGVQF